jgi:hypothetical protein
MPKALISGTTNVAVEDLLLKSAWPNARHAAIHIHIRHYPVFCTVRELHFLSFLKQLRVG